MCHFRTLSLWEPSQLNEELDRGFAIQQGSGTGLGDVSPWGPWTAAQPVPPKGHFYTNDYNRQKGNSLYMPQGTKHLFLHQNSSPGLDCHTSKALNAPLRPIEAHHLPVRPGHVTGGRGGPGAVTRSRLWHQPVAMWLSLAAPPWSAQV